MSDDVHVIIPIPPEGGGRGVVVCPLSELLGAVVVDGGTLRLDDLCIDSTFSDVEAVELIGAVRSLNATGDADAYWRIR